MSNNEVRIDPNSINSFIRQNPKNEDKTVLYLKGNHLNAIPLSETKLFDRVLAWFGFGPLSLRNISKFIQDYNVLEGKPDYTKKFSIQLLEKCEHYNQTHSISKVSHVFIDTLSQNSRLQFAGASSTVGRVKQNEVLDFAYSNAKLGTAYIIDVKGTPGANRREEWEQKFTHIKNTYEASLKEQRFSSIDEASSWFEQNLKPLTKLRGNFDFSWVQKIEIVGKPFLLTYHKGTPSVFIKHSDGEVYRTNRDDSSKATVFVDPLNRSDVIVGISDGLGDYIPKNVMVGKLKKVNIQSNRIFDNLVNKIVTGGIDPNHESASGNPTTKKIDATNKGDNIALFVLR